MTLDDYMRPAIPSDDGPRGVCRRPARRIWGADPKELSLLYVLQYAAAAGNPSHAGRSCA